VGASFCQLTTLSLTSLPSGWMDESNSVCAFGTRTRTLRVILIIQGDAHRLLILGIGARLSVIEAVARARIDLRVPHRTPSNINDR
jgi:hypothetical protein